APDDYRLEMIRLVARISDTHANLWRSLDVRPPRGSAEVPVTIRFVEGRAVVTGYSHAERGPGTRLLPGDASVAIAGAPVRSLVRAWAPYYAASNEPTRLRDIALSLTRGDAGTVTLTVLRDGARQEVTARRAYIAELDLAGARRHDL